jgi:hypothetical protein
VVVVVVAAAAAVLVEPFVVCMCVTDEGVIVLSRSQYNG